MTKHQKMKAIDFIKENGIDKARDVVEGAPELATHFINGEYVRVSDPRWILDSHISISELKRLVESVDLIEKVGGIKQARYFFGKFECVHIGLDLVQCRSIGKAIEDWESICGN